MRTTFAVLLFLSVCAGRLQAAEPAVAEAKQFVEAAQVKLLQLTTEAQQADWVKSTFITDDTEAMAARADERLIAATVELAKQSVRFQKLPLPPDLARKLYLLQNQLTLAAPADPVLSAEVTRLVTSMEGTYGKGKYCPGAGSALPKQTGESSCYDLEDLSKILAQSRDAAQLKEAWIGWHAISKPMRPGFTRFVDLSNQGARELGFADTGAMWRSQYDMAPDAFAQELDRIWTQMRPLYLSLHTYVRKKLREKYGDVVPAHGPIPAQFLGNMWAQDWSNIYDLVAPPDTGAGYDLSKILEARQTKPTDMVKYGEHFFGSLGFAPLPPTFWERSMLTKPRDRDVVCHASAWDIDSVNDLRIKMCIDITEEDFLTIHHELGHNFYQRAYDQQPFLFRNSANDGFHEAVGDTIALSVTPEYLVKIKLLQQAPDPSKDIALLLHKALEKVAFLPFGLLIDQWRWKVFNGEITPAQYNAAWWQLRLKYQGIAAPSPRTEADFDAAAKYHVAANVPYMRYFLADILQFQFHRSLSKIAGCTQPLNRCSIYGNTGAGARLNAMLSMGASQPWPDALAALTGQKQMDATAVVDYFAPLQKWLDEQNKGEVLGW